MRCRVPGHLHRQAAVLPVALFVIVLGGGTARAEEARDRAQARALFEEALEHADAERWEEAADRFGRAHELRPAPVIGYNLASALVHLDRFVEASEILESVVRDPATRDRTRRPAEQLLESIGPRMGRLTIRLDGDPTRAAVSVDDRELSSVLVGVAMRIDPGRHQVVVRRDDEVLDSRDVEIEEGASESTTFDLPEAPPAPEPPLDEPVPVPVPPEPPTPLVQQWWFWTALVAGIVVVVGASVGVGLALAPEEQDPISGSWGTVEIP